MNGTVWDFFNLFFVLPIFSIKSKKIRQEFLQISFEML